MKTLFVLFLIGIQASEAARLDEGMSLASLALRECIMEETTRLEPSGEPANAVVEGAVTACSRSHDNAIMMVSLWAKINRSLDTRSAVSVARDAVTAWEASYRQQAQLSVLESRAARATQPRP